MTNVEVIDKLRKQVTRGFISQVQFQERVLTLGETFAHNGKWYTAVSDMADTYYGPEIAVVFYDDKGDEFDRRQEPASVAMQIEWFKERY